MSKPAKRNPKLVGGVSLWMARGGDKKGESASPISTLRLTIEH